MERDAAYHQRHERTQGAKTSRQSTGIADKRERKSESERDHRKRIENAADPRAIEAGLEAPLEARLWDLQASINATVSATRSAKRDAIEGGVIEERD